MPIDLLNIQVELSVKDLKRARDFYCRIFSFVVKNETSEYVEFDNNILLRLDAKHQSDRSRRPLIFWVRGINVCYKELLEQGVHVLQTPTAQDNLRVVLFEDSEGNVAKMQELRN